MPQPVRQTRAHLTKLFERHGYHPRHDLGQNFLIDLNIIEAIVREAELTPDDVVLEVGTGTGGMTTFMAAEAGQVIGVEYDERMFALATEQAAEFDNITFIKTDALQSKHRIATEVLAAVESAMAVRPSRRLKLVANLPYNIATPIISNLVATELPWSRIVATIQLELAERMAASPQISNYGALSVWLQAQADVKLVRHVPPEAFWPRPDVDSAVIRLDPNSERLAKIQDRAFFHEFIRGLFTQRRKTLKSVISSLFKAHLSKADVEGLLLEEGLTASSRAEELPVEQLVSVSNRLRNATLPP